MNIDVSAAIKTFVARLRDQNRADEGTSSKKGTVVKLNRRQKLMIFASSAGIFLITLVTTFPLEAIVRHSINSAAQKGGFSLTFETIDLGIFGTTTIDNLEFRDKSTVIQVAQAQTDASLYSLAMGDEITGTFSAQSIRMQVSGEKFTALKIEGEADLIKEKVKTRTVFSGDAKVKVSQIAVPAMEVEVAKKMGIKIQLQPTIIQTLDIDATAKKNNFLFKKFELTSDVLQATAQGNLEVARSFGLSKINVRLCPKPTPKMYSLYTVADLFIKPNEDKLCDLRINGTFRKLNTNAQDLFDPTAGFKAGNGDGDDNAKNKKGSKKKFSKGKISAP